MRADCRPWVFLPQTGRPKKKKDLDSLTSGLASMAVGKSFNSHALFTTSKSAIDR